MVQYLIGGVIVVFLVLLIVGGLTGRVKAQNCCAIADPYQDLRMRTSDSAPPGANEAA